MGEDVSAYITKFLYMAISETAQASCLHEPLVDDGEDE